MKQEVREALEASIRHWEENRDARSPKHVHYGAEACALCDLFFHVGCVGCPVAHFTRKMVCSGSPYDRAVEAYKKWRVEEENGHEEFRAAAQAEVDFLRNLLPTSKEN